MDLNTFKKRVTSRGYSCPDIDDGFVIYKPISISTPTETIELTIESSVIAKKQETPLLINITRFDKKIRNDILAATIFCRNLSEMSLACAQIDLLTSDSMKSPFEIVKTSTDLEFSFRHFSWRPNKNIRSDMK